MPKMNINSQRKMLFSSPKCPKLGKNVNIMQTMISRLPKGESRVSYEPANLNQRPWTLIIPALNDGAVIP